MKFVGKLEKGLNDMRNVTTSILVLGVANLILWMCCGLPMFGQDAGAFVRDQYLEEVRQQNPGIQIEDIKTNVNQFSISDTDRLNGIRERAVVSVVFNWRCSNSDDWQLGIGGTGAGVAVERTDKEWRGRPIVWHVDFCP